jgi:hypothetical protein
MTNNTNLDFSVGDLISLTDWTDGPCRVYICFLSLVSDSLLFLIPLLQDWNRSSLSTSVESYTGRQASVRFLPRALEK